MAMGKSVVRGIGPVDPGKTDVRHKLRAPDDGVSASTTSTSRQPAGDTQSGAAPYASGAGVVRNVSSFCRSESKSVGTSSFLMELTTNDSVNEIE